MIILSDICKLTLKHGKYIKSHILPKALTRPAIKGKQFKQFGERTPSGFKRCSDSWYDQQIVIREGEDILRDYDNDGIKILKKHGLVWSSSKFKEKDGFFWVCNINNKESRELRLFFLSILWRAAVTEMKEFSEIELTDDDVEKIRLILLKKVEDDLSFFPISLATFDKKGEIHNFGGLKNEEFIPFPHNKLVNVFRFFIDGLIIRFYIDSGYDKNAPNILCNKKEIIINNIQWDNSWQRQNIILSILDAIKRQR